MAIIIFIKPHPPHEGLRISVCAVSSRPFHEIAPSCVNIMTKFPWKNQRQAQPDVGRTIRPPLTMGNGGILQICGKRLYGCCWNIVIIQIWVQNL